MIYNKISGFSDEIDSNIDIQFAVINKLGIKNYEPRFINGKNISELCDEEVYALKEKMDKAGVSASSIGSPIGKVKLSDDFDKHFELFERVCKTAKMLDCKYIRMFSFYHDGESWSEEERSLVFERLSKMIDYAKKENLILLHENEKDVYGDTTKRCVDLMENLYCDNFKAVFDPANFVQCGEKADYAFNKMNKYVAYMHIKDAKADDGTVVPAGKGDGCIKYILTSLFNKGYEGYLSLEPHLGSFDGLQNLELDDKMTNLPKSGEGTFTLAYNSLMEIIEEI